MSVDSKIGTDLAVLVQQAMSTQPPFRISKEQFKASKSQNKSYNVIVVDDSVNLMNYIMFAFSQIFGYSSKQSMKHVKEVQRHGQSILWSGMREQAENYVYLLQEWQLNAYVQGNE